MSSVMPCKLPRHALSKLTARNTKIQSSGIIIFTTTHAHPKNMYMQSHPHQLMLRAA